jgi:hypothetical protein
VRGNHEDSNWTNAARGIRPIMPPPVLCRAAG